MGKDEKMLRGVQKKAVVVKTLESKVFEEAIFFLRERTEEKDNNSDMVAEANKIISEVSGHSHSSAKLLYGFLRLGACFFGGAAFGSGAVLLCYLLR